MRVLITGCNGQLGKAVGQILGEKYELINTDVAELDITNSAAVLSLMREIRPFAIINSAAHTAVDKCETDIENAYMLSPIHHCLKEKSLILYFV